MSQNNIIEVIQKDINFETSLYKEFRETKIDLKKYNKLSQFSNNILNISRNYKKIKNLDQEQAKEIISAIITKISFYSGLHKIYKEQDCINLIQEAILDIINSFSNMTLQEVYFCLKSGIRGEIGNPDDSKYLSPSSFYKFLKYYNEVIKPKANKELKEVHQSMEVAPIPTKEQIKIQRDEWIKFMLKEYDQLRKTGVYSIVDMGNVFYNYLHENGLMETSEEQHSKYKKIAASILKSEYETMRSKRRISLLAYEKIINSLINISENQEVDNKAKSLILRDKLKAMAKNNIDLSDFIEI